LDDGFYVTVKRTYNRCVKRYGLARDEKGWRIKRVMENYKVG